MKGADKTSFRNDLELATITVKHMSKSGKARMTQLLQKAARTGDKYATRMLSLIDEIRARERKG